MGGPFSGEGALHGLSERLEAMVARRVECQKCLAVLAEEQAAFLQDMRALAQGRASVSTDGANAPVSPERPASPRGGARATAAPRSSLRTTSSSRSSAATACTATARTAASSGSGSPKAVRIQSTHEEAPPLKPEEGSAPPAGPSRAGHQKLDGGNSLFVHRGTHGTSGDKEASGLMAKSRAAARAALQASHFEPIIGVVILLNAVNIGWTIDKELRYEDTSTQSAIEVAFVLSFIAELALRIHAKGMRSLFCLWTAFDFLLISLTVVMMMMRFLIPSHSLMEAMNLMLMLRMLRLLRLVRIVRFVQVCRPLWKLVEGLLNCLGTMMSACLLLFMAIYIFACFGAELITKQYRGDAEVGAVVAKHFSSLPKIIMTLFQFLSMDGASDIYRPFVTRDPLLVVYFLLLVLLVSIALMNLITAVVVDDAISTTQMDQAMKKHYARMRLKEVSPALKELFHKVDSKGNRNGRVEVRELRQAVERGIEIPEKIQDIVNHGRLLDLFDLFDENEDGGLTEQEFVGGFGCLTLSDVPLDTMQILHVLRCIRREVMSLSKGPKEVEQDDIHVMPHLSVLMPSAPQSLASSTDSAQFHSEINREMAYAHAAGVPLWQRWCAEGGAQCRAPLDVLAQASDETFAL